MDSKRKLFIYDRREVGILILLGVGVALFAFTLGLHLGKQVNPPSNEQTVGHVTGEPVQPAAHSAPSRTEISEEVKNVPGAIEDTLDQTLRDEVTQSGLKLSTPKPLKLPEQKKSNPASAPTPAPVIQPPAKEKTETAPLSPKEAGEAPAPEGLKFEGSKPDLKPVHSVEYSLQIGSYPKKEEAEAALKALEEKALTGDIREAEIQGKGTWFRVLTGKFKSTAEAEKSGKALKDSAKIGEFIVVRANTN
jgi:cell division protein FtsN